VRLAATVLWLAMAAAALAQCPMCRNAAAAQGPEAASVLDLAILVLLVPAVSLFCGVYYFSFRYRNRGGEEE
jgi:heme/copper-type cytochrome/quinol oxidase subunit 2